MASVLWNPSLLQREIDRMLDGFGWASPRTGDEGPSANLGQDQDTYYVEMFLPGVAPDGLEVTVDEGVLRITGRPEAPGASKVVWHVSERRTGEFTHRLRLPKDAEAEKISADYTNGVLLVTIPKSPKPAPKHIEVNINQQ